MNPEQLRSVADLIAQLGSLDLENPDVTLEGRIAVYDADGSCLLGHAVAVDSGLWVFEPQ